MNQQLPKILLFPGRCPDAWKTIFHQQLQQQPRISLVMLLSRLGYEVWVGDAAKIRARDSRQQKHDKRDARLLLQLLVEDRFPRIWTPTREQKDLRQLLIHRYKLVGLRARVKNELQHLAMNQGATKKGKLWSKAGEKILREFPLAPWASQRRTDLFRDREMFHKHMTLPAHAVLQ